MRKLVLLIVTSLICLNLVACSATEVNKLSKQQKVEDFEYLFKTIEEAYPFLDVNKRINSIDWIANKETYLNKIKKTKNDREFIEAINEILSELNNGHTHLINTKEMFEYFKSVYHHLGWYEFLDSEIVLSRYDSIKEEDIKRTKDPIVKKDVIVKDVIEQKVGYMYLPQMYGVYGDVTREDIRSDMKIIGDYINTLENHNSLIIDIRGNTGGSDRYWMDIVSKLVSEDIQSTGYLVFRSESEILKAHMNKIAYKAEPIENFPKELLGNAPPEVMTDFSEFMESNFYIEGNATTKFEGNIYLLVDREVHSSSEQFSIFSKDSGFATLIGETTGGDGGGMDPILFDLKNSGLIVRMHSHMYLTGEGICNEELKTSPDYIVDDTTRTESFEDDQCIKKVLELENMVNL